MPISKSRTKSAARGAADPRNPSVNKSSARRLPLVHSFCGKKFCGRTARIYSGNSEILASAEH